MKSFLVNAYRILLSAGISFSSIKPAKGFTVINVNPHYKNGQMWLQCDKADLIKGMEDKTIVTDETSLLSPIADHIGGPRPMWHSSSGWNGGDVGAASVCQKTFFKQ